MYRKRFCFFLFFFFGEKLSPIIMEAVKTKSAGLADSADEI